MVEIICACIAAIASITVASIGIHIKKTNARIDKRAALRQQESLLSLRMMDATLQLSIVTSNALTGGYNNGNVEKARTTAVNVQEDYEAFLRQVTAQHVGK